MTVLDVIERPRLVRGRGTVGGERAWRDEHGDWLVERYGICARPELLVEYRQEQLDRFRRMREGLRGFAMSATPAFAVTPRQEVVQVVTANTNRDGTGTIADCLTGGASGTKIDEYGIIQDNDPADSVVTVFLYTGSAYRLYDEFDIGNPAASSTTLSGYREFRLAGNLYVTTSSRKFSGAITVALTAGNVNLWASGADF